MNMKSKYIIGVPSFDAAQCTLRDDKDARQIGRRKAYKMIFQSVLDGDHISLGKPIMIDGHIMRIIRVVDATEFARAIAEYESKLQTEPQS